MKTNILISLTTFNNPDWRKNIADLKKYGVTEFALFLTTLSSYDERLALMEAIKKELGNVFIPVTHLRADMKSEELDYLVTNFNTKKFNIHPKREFLPGINHSEYSNMTYIENGDFEYAKGLEDSDLKKFAGVCLDLAHIESAILLKQPGGKINLDMAKKYGIGFNHLSVITNEKIYVPEFDFYTLDSHHLSDLKELDYLKKYYPDYFGEYAAIELDNSIEEQLEIKKYLEQILEDKLS